MIVVLDASASIELVLHRPASPEIAEILSSAEKVFVPDIYIAEISNAFWKYVRAGGQSAFYEEMLDDSVDLADVIVPSTELYREAFAISVKHQHPVYDALYLVVARRNAAILLTLDRRLRRLAETLQLEIFPVIAD